MPIDHLIIHPSPHIFHQTVSFYVEALKPLGYAKRREYLDGAVVGFGMEKESPDFWIAKADVKNHGLAVSPIHLAFTAKDHETVNACHAAAVKSGGVNHGAPGIRTHSHAAYYGAFFYDPMGNNTEVVNHIVGSEARLTAS